MQEALIIITGVAIVIALAFLASIYTEHNNNKTKKDGKGNNRSSTRET